MSSVFANRLWFGKRGKQARLLPLDVKRIAVGPLETYGTRKFIPLQYQMENGQLEPLIIQFPRMFSPFELSAPRNQKPTDPPNRQFCVSFNDRESRPDIDEFFRLNEAIYEHVVDAVHEKQNVWFRMDKPMSREFIQDKIASPIRPKTEKDGREYPELISLKVRGQEKSDGTRRLQCVFWDSSDPPEPLATEDAFNLRRCDVVVVASLEKVTFMGRDMYLKYTAREVKIYENPFDVNTTVCGVVEANPTNSHSVQISEDEKGRKTKLEHNDDEVELMPRKIDLDEFVVTSMPDVDHPLVSPRKQRAASTAEEIDTTLLPATKKRRTA